MTIKGVVLHAILKIGGAALVSLIACISAHVVMPLLILTPISTGIAAWIAFLDSSIDQAKRSGNLPVCVPAATADVGLALLAPGRAERSEHPVATGQAAQLAEKEHRP